MIKPERLNLAIGKYCFVDCPGCYMFFGDQRPDLNTLKSTVAAFVELGINKVTISGGDPLTVAGLTDFIIDIREAGVNLVKLDTVGTSLIKLNTELTHSQSPTSAQRLRILADVVDYIGIPLDGWSNETSLLFRKGRPFLYDETVELLHGFDGLNRTPNIVINTVIHKGNFSGAEKILEEIALHRSITHWNIFQYTATDQAKNEANELFAISNEDYRSSCNAIQNRYDTITAWAGQQPTFEFRSVESRLGSYLLINSDGNAWLPNEDGTTHHLGNIYGNEEKILRAWSDLAEELKPARQLNDLPKLLTD